MANDLNSTKCQKSFHFMILQFYPLRYKIYYNESYVPSVVKCASVVDVSLLCFVEWITVYMWLWKKERKRAVKGWYFLHFYDNEEENKFLLLFISADVICLC